MARSNYTKPGERRHTLPVTPEGLASEWWRKDGIYIDPDTDEVDWFEKRRELAEIAFVAGFRKAREGWKP